MAFEGAGQGITCFMKADKISSISVTTKFTKVYPGSKNPLCRARILKGVTVGPELTILKIFLCVMVISVTKLIHKTSITRYKKAAGIWTQSILMKINTQRIKSPYITQAIMNFSNTSSDAWAGNLINWLTFINIWLTQVQPADNAVQM